MLLPSSPPPAAPFAVPGGFVHAGGEEPGRGDVGAELGQGPGLVRALKGPRGAGGAVPDPRGGSGREVGGEPGHAITVRDVLHPPVRDTAGMACFDADRVVPFPPGAGFRPEPGRDKVPGGAAAGRGGRVRVQEMRLQSCSSGPVEVGGFVHHDPGVLPRNGPGLQRGQCQRKREPCVVSVCARFTRRALAVRSLTVRTHATSAVMAISWAVRSCGDTAGAAIAVAASAYSAARCTFRAAISASTRDASASPSRHASARSRRGSPPPDHQNHGGAHQPTPRRKPRQPPTPPPRLCFPYPQHPSRH